MLPTKAMHTWRNDLSWLGTAPAMLPPPYAALAPLWLAAPHMPPLALRPMRCHPALAPLMPAQALLSYASLYFGWVQRDWSMQ